MSQNGNSGPKKRGRPSKADKLAIELARRVAGAVSAAAVAAKVSAAKAREQVVKKARGRPPKVVKSSKVVKPSKVVKTSKVVKVDVREVKKEEEEKVEEEEEVEEVEEVVRPKSRRKGEPRRAPGSTADWFQRPMPAPSIRRQPRDIKHLDLGATEIGKRETRRNPKFDEFVTFTPKKVESSADETSRNPLSSEAASDFDTDSNVRTEKTNGSMRTEEGSEVETWNSIKRYIDETRASGLLSKEEAEKLETLVLQQDGHLGMVAFDPSMRRMDFAESAKWLLKKQQASGL